MPVHNRTPTVDVMVSHAIFEGARRVGGEEEKVTKDAK